MATPVAKGTPRTQHELRIRPVVGNELKNKIHAAVAWRAYQFYEESGRVFGHDLEDWERAEAKVVRPMDCGALVEDSRVCLTVDASLFDDGPVELYVEPQRITLCGYDRSRRPLPPPPGEPPRPRRDWIFRVHDFDVEVDPRTVTARFNGPVLNVYLGKAQPREVQPVLAMAS